MSDYKYGDREDEIQHAMREIQQLRAGYRSGVLSECELVQGVGRVRERYGLRDWNPGP